MKQRLQLSFGCITLLLVSAFVGIGCDGDSQTKAPPEPTITVEQITRVPGPTLTANEEIVTRNRKGEEVEIHKSKPLPIEIEDEISTKQGGRGTLIFPTLLEVELFDRTTLNVATMNMDPMIPYTVNLDYKFGSSRMELSPAKSGILSVGTQYAEITAEDAGAEFLVCHSEILTCVVVLEGEVLVRAQGILQTVRSSEAVNILEGEPPQVPVCINQTELQLWLNNKRNAIEEEPLGAHVARWIPLPCSPGSSSTATPAQATPDLPASPPPVTPANVPIDPDMVRIDEGSYLVGRPDPDEFHVAEREIEVAAYLVDRHEVTNVQYQIFLDENNLPPPAGWPGGDFTPGREDYPVKGITWDTAKAYCEWRNKRLPTEVEWEIAARGPESLLYPWGNDPFAGGIADLLPKGDTYAVGSKPQNRSHFDVYDMAGNVWEWVGDPYDALASDNHKLLRGGRHGLLRDMAYRQSSVPDAQPFVSVAGIRCAADATGSG